MTPIHPVHIVQQLGQLDVDFPAPDGPTNATLFTALNTLKLIFGQLRSRI